MGRLTVIAVFASAAASTLGWPGLAQAHQSMLLAVPTIIGASDRTVAATFGCGQSFCAIVDLTAGLTATEPGYSSDQIAITCNNPNGTLHAVTYPVGTGLVTCQATDPVGNFSQVQFTITVTVPPPTFQNVPGPITAVATGPFGAVVTFVKPSATDVGGGSDAVSCDQTSGITFPVGLTTVNCTATITRLDSVGNPVTFATATVQFTITVAELPGAPTAVSATAADGQATISFTPPASNGGASISSYTVTSAPGGQIATGAKSPILVTGLTNGTTYTFTVTATNAAGTGPASAQSNAVTPTAPPDFIVQLSPSTQTVTQGQAATFAVTTITTGGFSDHLNFSSTAAPPGSSAQFSPSGPSTLTVTTSASTPVGSYPVTITVANDAGNLARTASSTLTVSAVAGGGGGTGGGGGGGGSSTLGLTVSPLSQTISSGSTATWTIAVTNSGGAYLYAVGVKDAAAPSCGIPSAFADTAAFMPPGVTISYTCSSPGVTASFTNTVLASATTGPGDVIGAATTASVTVQPLTPPPSAPVSVLNPKPSPDVSKGAALVVSGLATIRLNTPKPKLSLTVKASKATTLSLTLLDSGGHKLASWSERAQPGKQKLSLLLPANARHPGHDKLRITETGHSTPKRLSITLRV